MKRIPLAWVFIWAIFFVIFVPAKPLRSEKVPEPAGKRGSKQKEVSLDFNNVDLPVLVKLISELTGKNFVLDEKVRGKVSLVSPSKIPVDHVFDVFLSVLELKGLTVVQRGDVYQIRPFAEVPPERSVHVVGLKNMKAEEIAKVIRGLVAKPGGRSRKPLGPTKELSAQVQILSEKETNSLIITATDGDFQILKGVIEKLDVRRRQVYVEAVVLEISADKFDEIGTELGAAFGYVGSDLTVLGGFNNQLDLAALASIGNVQGLEIGAINIQAVITALKSSSDVNILSTPQILTSDKQKAEIVVAQNVPFPGGETQTGGVVTTTVERKDVGIILRLTPDILEDNIVHLDVYQEISSVLETVQSEAALRLGPTTNKRSASTTIIVRDGRTVVIGGLIRDNLITVERKIPLLGDIPILGWLFRFRSKRVEKTNLMIFLTPHIVLNEQQLEEIRRKKSGDAAGFVEDRENQLETWSASFNEIVNLPKGK
ncbi:MAG: secretin N-terminal domain-containing protein [Nitrospiria bacterium]